MSCHTFLAHDRKPKPKVSPFDQETQQRRGCALGNVVLVSVWFSFALGGWRYQSNENHLSVVSFRAANILPCVQPVILVWSLSFVLLSLTKFFRLSEVPLAIADCAFTCHRRTERHVNRAALVTLASSTTTVGAATVERMLGGMDTSMSKSCGLRFFAPHYDGWSQYEQ